MRQYLFSYISLVALGGNFIVVDSILLALLFVGILLPVHEWRTEKRKAKIRSNLTEEELDFEKEMDKI